MTDAQTTEVSAGGLLAPLATSPHQRVAGLIALVGGVLMIAASFVDWAEYPDGPHDDARVGLSPLGGTLPEGTSYGSATPGVWTAVFGALVALGGVAILVRRGVGVAGLIAGLAGVAGFVVACTFLIDPVGAFGLAAPTLPVDQYFPYSGAALWVLFGASLFGSVAGAQAVVLALRRDRPNPF
ncbi:MAG: hypothetical protein QM658_01145 [Gordonia sp. (in: high G+C Gram-positive bacteria)]